MFHLLSGSSDRNERVKLTSGSSNVFQCSGSIERWNEKIRLIYSHQLSLYTIGTLLLNGLTR
jgi:hypothetical protein